MKSYVFKLTYQVNKPSMMQSIIGMFHNVSKLPKVFQPIHGLFITIHLIHHYFSWQQQNHI